MLREQIRKRSTNTVLSGSWCGIWAFEEQMSTSNRSPPTRGTKCTVFPSFKSADLGYKIKDLCFSPNSFRNCRSSAPTFGRSFRSVRWSCLWTAMSTIRKSSLTRGMKHTEFLSSRSIDSCQNLKDPCFSPMSWRSLDECPLMPVQGVSICD